MTAAPRPPWWRPFARRRWDRAAQPLPADFVRRLAAQVEGQLAELGLVVAGEYSGGPDCGVLRLGDRQLPLQFSWRDVPADERLLLRAAAELTASIARDHGPGRIWTFPVIGAVHPVYDDGQLVVLHRGKPQVRLRLAYYHEACRAPEPAP